MKGEAFKEKGCGWDYTTSFGNLLVRGEVEGGIIQHLLGTCMKGEGWRVGLSNTF